MVNESSLIIETELPINFTCANATGIERGALLKMTDPMTAALAANSNDVVAGICAAEKIASDGITKVAVFRNGVFKVLISGSVSVGDALMLASNNAVKTISSVSGGNMIGTALETGTTGETIFMELNPMAQSRA